MPCPEFRKVVILKAAYFGEPLANPVHIIMNYSVSRACTSENDVQELAEAYVLKRLPATDLEQYEEHLLVCERCQTAIEEFDVFLSTARALFAEYPDDKPRRRKAQPRSRTAAS